jgi:hypothetical protein
MEWATLIVSLAKAIPAIQKIFESSVELYYAEENREDENHTAEINQEREAIAASLKQPGLTDENRRALRKRLIALSRL